jgi:aminoglycoside 3-N-acetyltransferase
MNKCKYKNSLEARHVPPVDDGVITSRSSIISSLACDWRDSGIKLGDTVLIHSSVTRLTSRLRRVGVVVSVQDILDSFRAAVGASGTLLLPTFNFEFAAGKQFDIRTTPSHMGALTETARIHAESVRTGHPIYSFSVIGHNSNLFKGLTNFSGYGADSPFGLLMKMGGKIAALDLPDEKCMTFYHYVEESENVPYRYHKVFSGEYTDADGCTGLRSFGLFVRDLDIGVETDVQPMGQHLWELGICTGYRPGEGNGLRTMCARAVFDATRAIIQNGEALGMLYRLDASNHTGKLSPT